MLNFRNITVLFTLALIGTVTANFFFHIPFFVYVLLVFIYSLVLFYGSYFIHSNFYIKVICAAVTAKKEIAISFDDGPAVSYTPEILKVLKENNVQAAFFCIGQRIPGNEGILRQVHEEGHIIGNHSYSHHFWFDLFSAKKMLADMRMMDGVTRNVIGLRPVLFRPPYGVTNPNLKKAIIQGKYLPIGWSVRSLDTVIHDEARLLKKISAVKNGDIVLFHDTSQTTLGILQTFIRKVKSEGYEIVRLDKMLNLEPYA